MARFWTCHWQNRHWRDDVNPEYEPVCDSGSNSFRKRGVAAGDIAYIVSIADGHLLLGGRMMVKRIVSRAEAVKIWNNDNLYDAEEFIIDEAKSGTPLDLHRRLDSALTRRLRFVSPRSGPKGLFFASEMQLDNQATRGVRELTPESAALLDQIIEISDQLPRSGELITVTEEMLNGEPRLSGQKGTDRSEAIQGRLADGRSSRLAFVDGFNPSIDRYDSRRVVQLFRWLWPDPDVSVACARTLATSIRAAHEAADACWEVTMFPDALRLNVGQVEALTLTADDIRFLVRAPLTPEIAATGEVDVRSDPIYPAVPVPSRLFLIAASDLPSLPAEVRQAHDAYIKAAASFKKVSPFKKSFSPAVLEYLEATLATSLPRPIYLTGQAAHQRVNPLPDELDTSMPIHEGAKYRVSVNAYERNPRARQICLARHGTGCVICGFSFGAKYGKVVEGFIHVHHLRSLAEIGEEYEVDPIEDLRPVCPNCHAVLHRRVPPFSIEEVQAFLKQSVHA